MTKARIHKLIDSIESEEVLAQIEEFVSAFSTKSTLSNQQKEILLRRIANHDNAKFSTWEEVKRIARAK